ncbi:hypothetical protein HAX54_010972 [Datura stramonium]|uniref:Retrotransposon Copia-like N-terminal domain-containing protein n=1 Tax=Datura stramonium TaxID=4076 RepID=A0ABS8X0V2_DATST|nr:hypothetical protein [Datura stramonium]
MAPNTSNTSAQSFSSSSSASLTDASSLLPSSPSAISVSNIKNLVPTILDFTNYALWRELFLPIFKGHGFYGFIDENFPCPEPTILRDDENDTTAFVTKQQSSSSYGCRRGLHSNSGRHSIDGRGCGRYTQGNAKSFNSVPQQFTPCPRLPSIPGPPPISILLLTFHLNLLMQLYTTNFAISRIILLVTVYL